MTNLLFIDPINIPDFLMEIILTHVTTHCDNYEGFVSYNLIVGVKGFIDADIAGCRKFNSVTTHFKETYSL